MESSPSGWLELIGGLVGLIGAPAVAVIITVAVLNRVNAKKRKGEGEDTEEIATAPAVHALRSHLDRIDNHVKEGFHAVHGSVRDLAHATEDMSQQVDFLSSDMKEMRDDIHRLASSVHERTNRARERKERDNE